MFPNSKTYYFRLIHLTKLPTLSLWEAAAGCSNPLTPTMIDLALQSDLAC